MAFRLNRNVQNTNFGVSGQAFRANTRSRFNLSGPTQVSAPEGEYYWVATNNGIEINPGEVGTVWLANQGWTRDISGNLVLSTGSGAIDDRFWYRDEDDNLVFRGCINSQTSSIPQPYVNHLYDNYIYRMRNIHTEIQKIDATGGAKTATIPAGTIAHSAHVTTPGKRITVTVNGDTSILAIGESLDCDQIVMPGNNLGTYPAKTILFESGSEGTVTYVAASDLGSITVV